MVLRQVLNGRLEVLGKKHPQTLNARGALAMVLLELRGPVEVRTAARPLPTS